MLSDAYSTGPLSATTGILSVEAGVSSTEFSLPPDAPVNANVRVTISAYGDVPGATSFCLVSDAVDVVFP